MNRWQSGFAATRRQGEAAIRRLREANPRLNAYHCTICGGYIVTIDRDEGVTPMFLACRATRGCPGRSVSMGYPKLPWPAHAPEPVPRWEWYRPTLKWARRKGPGMVEYVQRGGLEIREIGAAA
jgi:hypothetical protein